MDVAILFSGGKDSVFSCYWAIQQGWEVKCLVTIVSEKTDSWMFHTPNIRFTSLQAEAMGLPILIQKTKGEKEDELSDLRSVLLKAKKQYNIEGLVVGALASDYQQERVNRICEDISIKTFSPLWHKEQGFLLKEMIDCGFDIIIQSIAAEGLDESWLGRHIDAKALEDLKELNRKSGMHIAGEGGEYESFVLDGPIFRKRLVITKSTKISENKNTGILKISKMELEDKK
jgi:ABC transporter with metal-binding/Fe-S-binding domain ATP-binding protein